MTHTPGPWHVSGSSIGTADPSDQSAKFIASANSGAWSTKQCEANARLIAAAPELLEALRLLDQAHNGPWDGSEQERYIAIANDKARAAIAKATS